MGNQESQIDQDILDGFEKLNQQQNQIMDGYIMQQKTSQLQILVRQIYADEGQFVLQYPNWKSRLHLRHPNIVQMLAIQKKRQENFCSSSFVIYAISDILYQNLEQKINQDNKNLQESELTFIAYSIVNGLNYLEKQNLSHKPLQMRNIYVTKECQYKIADDDLIDQPDLYMIAKNFQQFDKNTFFSPQQLIDVRNKQSEYTPTYSLFRSDIYTLGIIMIHLSLREDCNEIYDYQNLTIKKDVLNHKLSQLKPLFTKEYVKLIENMVQEEELVRPSSDQILKYLKDALNINQKIILDKKIIEMNEINSKYLKMFMQSQEYSIKSKKSQFVNMSLIPADASYKELRDAQNKLNQAYIKYDHHKIVNDILQKHFPLSDPDEKLGLFQNQNFKKSYIPAIYKEIYLSQAHSQIEKDFTPHQKPEMKDISVSQSQIYSPRPKRYSVRVDLGLKNSKLEESTYLDVSQKNFKNLSPKSQQKKVHFEESDIKSSTFIEQKYENGSFYRGNITNGERNGNGRFDFADGGFYEGQWKNGKMHGIGNLYFSNQKPAYEGEWREDFFHGNGTLYNGKLEQLPIIYQNLNNKSWVKYEGQFDYDQKQGQGTIYYYNGEKYDGQFYQDLIHGKGKFFDINGDVIHGIWNKGKLQEKL